MCDFRRKKSGDLDLESRLSMSEHHLLLCSTHPHGSKQPSSIPPLEDLTSSSCLSRHYTWIAQTNTQPAPTHIKLKLNKS